MTTAPHADPPEAALEKLTLTAVIAKRDETIEGFVPGFRRARYLQSLGVGTRRRTLSGKNCRRQHAARKGKP